MIFVLDWFTKLLPGLGNGWCRKYTQWIFHPYLPLVISSQHTLIRSSSINIHYRASPLANGRSGVGPS